jgi:hypothetical protein
MDVKYLFAHELTHIYQYNEYMVINSYWNPLVSGIKSKTVNAIFKWINIELPHEYILYYSVAYTPKHYYRNIYEFEAEFFSTNSYFFNFQSKPNRNEVNQEKCFLPNRQTINISKEKRMA